MDLFPTANIRRVCITITVMNQSCENNIRLAHPSQICTLLVSVEMRVHIRIISVSRATRTMLSCDERSSIVQSTAAPSGRRW